MHRVPSGNEIFRKTYDVDAAIQKDIDILNNKKFTTYAELQVTANLSSWYFLKGDLDKSLQYAQKALSMHHLNGALHNGINPGIPHAYGQVAICLLQQKKVSDALEQWSLSKTNLNMLEHLTGPLSEEIKKEVISNNYVLHGLILFENGSFEAAKKEFGNALKIKPELISEVYSFAKGLALKGYDYGTLFFLEQLILLDSTFLETIKNANLFDNIINTPDFIKFKQNFEKSIAPADIYLALEYADTNSIIPNNTIDAGEQSSITAQIINEGRGTAFGVKIEVNTIHTSIDFPAFIAVGDIQPGDRKKVE